MTDTEDYLYPRPGNIRAQLMSKGQFHVDHPADEHGVTDADRARSAAWATERAQQAQEAAETPQEGQSSAGLSRYQHLSADQRDALLRAGLADDGVPQEPPSVTDRIRQKAADRFTVDGAGITEKGSN